MKRLVGRLGCSSTIFGGKRAMFWSCARRVARWLPAAWCPAPWGSYTWNASSAVLAKSPLAKKLICRKIWPRKRLPKRAILSPVSAFGTSDFSNSVLDAQNLTTPSTRKLVNVYGLCGRKLRHLSLRQMGSSSARSGFLVFLLPREFYKFLCFGAV